MQCGFRLQRLKGRKRRQNASKRCNACAKTPRARPGHRGRAAGPRGAAGNAKGRRRGPKNVDFGGVISGPTPILGPPKSPKTDPPGR